MRKGRGFSLVELAISLVVGAILLSSLYRVLLTSQRFYRAQAAILGVQQNVRAAAHLLAEELRALDAPDGDLIALSDTAVTLKAMRIFATTCAPASPATSGVVLRDALTFGYRGIDPARDSLLLYLEADTTSSGEKWLHAAVQRVSAGAACADSTPGTRLTLVLAAGGATQLARVATGAPVRAFEVVSYRLYRDAGGAWWLGQRSLSGGAWGSTTPVAGPLRPVSGLTLRGLDAAGSPAAPRQVAQIEITVRGRSLEPISVQGLPPGPYRDSLTLRVALRND